MNKHYTFEEYWQVCPSIQDSYELYYKLQEENDILNNIINELEKRLEEGIEDNKKEYSLKSQMAVFVLRDVLELIEELKGSDKE